MILRNQRQKEEERKKQLQDGIEERDIIIEVDPDKDEIAQPVDDCGASSASDRGGAQSSAKTKS